METVWKCGLDRKYNTSGCFCLSAMAKCLDMFELFLMIFFFSTVYSKSEYDFCR